ncbi:MAG: NifU family protein, partial [Gemmatimonadota bacterium]|nr:NifU family protein [Gemmatimonadota bacterium]
MLTFTDRAREVVQAYLDQSSGELEALRISRQPGSPVAPNWELTLVGADERTDAEREVDGSGFPVLIREDDAELLTGATVEYVERVNEAGFEVRTVASPPSVPESSAATTPVAAGLEDRVKVVLTEKINPAISGHGGFISLVDVSGTEVFVEMGGGCQGCALSRMTLSQ